MEKCNKDKPINNVVMPEEVYKEFKEAGVKEKYVNFDKDKLKELLGHIEKVGLCYFKCCFTQN